MAREIVLEIEKKDGVLQGIGPKIEFGKLTFRFNSSTEVKLVKKILESNYFQENALDFMTCGQ